MTEQTEGAEAVEMRHCDGCGEDYNAFEESHVGHEASAVEALADLIFRDPDEPMWSAMVIARHILASDWLAAREAAAEVRGAQAVLAAVEATANGLDWEYDAQQYVNAARAAAAAAGGGGEGESRRLPASRARVKEREHERAARRPAR